MLKLRNLGEKPVIIRQEGKENYVMSFSGWVFYINEIFYRIIIEINNNKNNKNIINELHSYYNQNIIDIKNDFVDVINILLKMKIIDNNKFNELLMDL